MHAYVIIFFQNCVEVNVRVCVEVDVGVCVENVLAQCKWHRVYRISL